MKTPKGHDTRPNAKMAPVRSNDAHNRSNRSPNIRDRKDSRNRSDIELLQQHLKEVIEGAAFKASHRSGQFLKYIVDQAIAGHFESLKERSSA